MDNKKDMLDIKGTIVPWALPREKIPVHVELPKNLVFDEIHIKVPYDFEFVDFLNVDEVIIEKELAKITKVMRPTLKDVPMYFGFVIVSTKIPEEIKIAKRITIEFIRNNEVINALNLIARIFRPKIEITKSIEKIELVDDQERFNAPINLKYIGFGDIKLRIEAEIGGRIVSHGESIIYELLRRLWLSEVIESENKKEKEKTKKKVHVKPDFIREISEQLEKKIESEDLSGILTMIDEEDIEDFKRWLSEIKNRERFMEVMYSRIEDLLLDLLAELLERHPTENVKLASSRTKVKAKIELPMEIITIRLRYTDSLENEYSSVEISIKIEDKRMKKKGAIIEIPIIIEKWEEEPLMNVAEMIVGEGK